MAEYDDLQQIKLISVFNYVFGGIIALLACIPFIHLTLGIVFLIMSQQPTTTGDPPPPAFVGWIFIFAASIIILVGWTLAICIMIAGRNLNRKKHYTYCFVFAAIQCLFMPLGTALGVFSIIVLMRQSVKDMFEGEKALKPA